MGLLSTLFCHCLFSGVDCPQSVLWARNCAVETSETSPSGYIAGVCDDVSISPPIHIPLWFKEKL